MFPAYVVNLETLMAFPQEKIDKDPQYADGPDLTKEYVAGFSPWSARIGSVLSNFTDDIEALIGADVYERMARDPAIWKGYQFQKLSVSCEEIHLHPAISDDQDPEFEKANEIKEFHERSLSGLHRPLSQIVGEMMVAVKRAHSIAEITYKEPVATGVDKYKLLLKSIKVKPRNTTAFVIDPYRNVLGLTAWHWGQIRNVSSDELKQDGRELIHPEKFAVLAFETEDEDPRGLNPLRAAYNFWQAKCLVPPLHLKWLEKSGLPSTVGFTAQNAGTLDNPNATDKKSPQEVMVDTLASLESGSSAAFPFGAKVEKIEVSGNGTQFTRCYENFDQQIDYAVLLSSGATKDSQKGTYGAKRVIKDVVDILIWSRKQSMAQVLYGVLRCGTRYNFGEEFEHLTPTVMVGDEEGRDFSADADAVANLGKYLTDSQFLQLLKEIGVAAPKEGEVLPPRGVVAAPNDEEKETGPSRNQKTDQRPNQREAPEEARLTDSQFERLLNEVRARVSARAA